VIKLGPHAEATTSIGERRTNLCQSIWDKSEVLLGTLCYLLASKRTRVSKAYGTKWVRLRTCWRTHWEQKKKSHTTTTRPLVHVEPSHWLHEFFLFLTRFAANFDQGELPLPRRVGRNWEVHDISIVGRAQIILFFKMLNFSKIQIFFSLKKNQFLLNRKMKNRPGIYLKIFYFSKWNLQN